MTITCCHLRPTDNPSEIAENLCNTGPALLTRNQLRDDTFHVYVDMVGDLFHSGHMNLIRQAMLKGYARTDEKRVQVIVGLNSDEGCEGYKRKPMNSLAERVAAAVQCCHTDAVLFPAPLVLDKETMNNLHIDLVVHGDDFDPEKMRKYYSLPINLGIFATVPYTKGISTSKLIKRIQSRPAV